MKNLYFNWSTGKDSALALYHLLEDPSYNVKHLVTTINSHLNRVTMHGLSRSLMEKQIQQLKINHSTIELPENPSMEEYNALAQEFVGKMKTSGIDHAGFGDIFLEDLKKYREEQLKTMEVNAVFPLWQKNTLDLIKEFIETGFKATVVCINGNLLDESFVGRELDQSFIDDLPEGVDPCGENGEFHTFCYDGPIFNSPILFEKGENIYKEYKSPTEEDQNVGFWFHELIG